MMTPAEKKQALKDIRDALEIATIITCFFAAVLLLGWAMNVTGKSGSIADKNAGNTVEENTPTSYLTR